MTITEQAIQNLADAFCLIGKPEHRATYVESLRAITDLAKSEQILQMQLDFDRCMRVTLRTGVK